MPVKYFKNAVFCDDLGPTYRLVQVCHHKRPRYTCATSPQKAKRKHKHYPRRLDKTGARTTKVVCVQYPSREMRNYRSMAMKRAHEIMDANERKGRVIEFGAALKMGYAYARRKLKIKSKKR